MRSLSGMKRSPLNGVGEHEDKPREGNQQALFNFLMFPITKVIFYKKSPYGT